MKVEKRGQVTIFIIVAVVIIAAIGGYFLLKSDIIPGLRGDSGEIDPNSFLDSCLKDKIREGVDSLLENGGYINPSLTIMHNDKDISYLCYNQNSFAPCVNQQSLLIRHLEEELYNHISGDVDKCFKDELVSSLDKKGYTVGVRYVNGDFEVDLRDGEFVVDIDAELTLTKTGETTKQKDFSVLTPTRLYNLAMVVREIVSQEIKYCYFSDTGYNIMYPGTRVIPDNIRDESKIYTVEDVNGDEKFWFAVRGCGL